MFSVEKNDNNGKQPQRTIKNVNKLKYAVCINVVLFLA